VLPTGSDAARRSVTSIPSSSPPIKNIDLLVHGSEFRFRVQTFSRVS
jgi:hypothetical protein